jgi:chromosome partitioning protein
MKGGVGKTTLALNVADCLSRVHNKKVAVIDVDPQFNATQCMFSGSEYVTLLSSGADTILNVFDTDIRPVAGSVSGPGKSEPKELKDIVLQQKHGLYVLPGSIDLYRLEMISGEGREFSLKRFISECIEPQGFDYVIIDTPPTPSIWMASALIASNYFLIPVKPDPLSMIGIDLLRSIIERKRKNYGLNLECLGVVFTMVERSDSTVHAEAKRNLLGNKYWKDYLFNKHLPKRTALARAQLEQPFILKQDDFELRQALKDIVDELRLKANDE